MNPSITRILMISLILASSAFAETETEEFFPALGKTYDVTWASSARETRAQIKVISKGDGSWIFVECSYIYHRPAQRSQPGKPGTAKEPQAPKLEKGPSKRMWINTHWLIDASESEVDTKQDENTPRAE